MRVQGMLIGLAVLAAAGVPTRGAAQAFEYAVKVVCGSPNASQLAPGRYFTAINLHSPQDTEIRFKVATTQPGLQPGIVTPFRNGRLGADQAIEIDCRVVQSMTNAAFTKGFVVIQSRTELDVVAVYTAGAAGATLTTMDVERVEPRRLQ